MTRQIKFRAWDKENKCWYAPVHEAYRGNLFELLIGFSGELVARTTTAFEDESLWPDRFDLMQFTGLQDKKGKDVYEGDLLRVRYSLNEGKEGFYVEGIHQAQLSLVRGLRLRYLKRGGNESDLKNQNPINLILSLENQTLGVDYRNEQYDRLAVLDTWTKRFDGNNDKVNDYSNNIEIVGNIYETTEGWIE